MKRIWIVMAFGLILLANSAFAASGLKARYIWFNPPGETGEYHCLWAQNACGVPITVFVSQKDATEDPHTLYDGPYEFELEAFYDGDMVLYLDDYFSNIRYGWSIIEVKIMEPKAWSPCVAIWYEIGDYQDGYGYSTGINFRKVPK